LPALEHFEPGAHFVAIQSAIAERRQDFDTSIRRALSTAVPYRQPAVARDLKSTPDARHETAFRSAPSARQERPPHTFSNLEQIGRTVRQKPQNLCLDSPRSSLFALEIPPDCRQNARSIERILKEFP
jgi:hypothetical protein